MILAVSHISFINKIVVWLELVLKNVINVYQRVTREEKAEKCCFGVVFVFFVLPMFGSGTGVSLHECRMSFIV